MEVVHMPHYAAQRLALDPVEVAKLEQAAQVHGYRGASRKRHNGVVPIRPTDKHLLAFFNQHFRSAPAGLAVKVVAHVPSGNRLVGVLAGATLYILGAANYTGRVKT